MSKLLILGYSAPSQPQATLVCPSVQDSTVVLHARPSSLGSTPFTPATLVCILTPTNTNLLYEGSSSGLQNLDRQVRQDATLNFTGDGDLVLRDADGSLVWSSNTSGRSVIGVNMMESGNLVLFDHHNVTVWQSFDYPVDSLLPASGYSWGKASLPTCPPSI